MLILSRLIKNHMVSLFIWLFNTSRKLSRLTISFSIQYNKLSEFCITIFYSIFSFYGNTSSNLQHLSNSFMSHLFTPCIDGCTALYIHVHTNNWLKRLINKNFCQIKEEKSAIEQQQRLLLNKRTLYT